jgi:hypothetical protein
VQTTTLDASDSLPEPVVESDELDQLEVSLESDVVLMFCNAVTSRELKWNVVADCCGCAEVVKLCRLNMAIQAPLWW